MRNKVFSLPVGLLLTFLLMLLFQDCAKDKCTRYYIYWEPVYKTSTEVRTNVKSNPSRKIERPGKIYIRGNYIFLNEVDKGVHIIDNSNPSDPQNIAFVDIPGNLDMAVKGNMLYADLYTDLVALDISDPQHVIAKKFTENVFPERHWDARFRPDSGMIVTDWIKRDTIVPTPCGGNTMLFGGEKELIISPAEMSSGGNGGPMASATATPFGMGGSLASFAIVNNYLYAVSNTALNVVSISNAADPILLNRANVGMDIETIYPFNNRLFIGSATGIFIYDISVPVNPVKLGAFGHTRFCDPVIADNNNAFVTLRSGGFCGGFTNQLDVLNIASITDPVLIRSYIMMNPYGLAKDGNTLIICDGFFGLKFYDASDVSALAIKATIKDLDARDVIAVNGWALVMAKDGLYQYDYSTLNNIRLLSKLGIQ